MILPESGKLPFRDGEFEVVYCSSVIEHVTGFNKDETWQVLGAESPKPGVKLSNSSRERNPTYFEAVLCPDPGTQFPGRIPHVAAGRRVALASRSGETDQHHQPAMGEEDTSGFPAADGY